MAVVVIEIEDMSVRKFVFVILLLYGFPCLGQQETQPGANDSTTNKIGVISQSLLSSDCLSVSLTDSAAYDNFESKAESLRIPQVSILLTATKSGSQQRVEFVALFFKARDDFNRKAKQKNKTSGLKDIKKAYQIALEEIRKKYPNPDFKSMLLPPAEE